MSKNICPRFKEDGDPQNNFTDYAGQLRTQLGLSRQGLADLTALSLNQITNYESWRARPPIKYIAFLMTEYVLYHESNWCNSIRQEVITWFLEDLKKIIKSCGYKPSHLPKTTSGDSIQIDSWDTLVEVAYHIAAKTLIIYDWENRTEVAALVKAFRKNGVHVRWDQDWPYWENDNKKIETEIKNTDHVFVYKTELKQEDEQLANEHEFAEKNGKQVVILTSKGGRSLSVQLALDKEPVSVSGDLIEDIAMKLIEMFKLRSQSKKPSQSLSPKELIEEAHKENHCIPTDIITEKLFLSPIACHLIEMAYEQMTQSAFDAKDPTRLKIILEYNRVRRFRGDWATAAEELRQTMPYAEENKELYLLYCLDSGSLEFERGNIIGGQRTVEEALSIAHSQGNTFLLVKILRQLGNMYAEQGKFDEARDKLAEALVLAKYIHGSSISISSDAVHILRSDCIREWGSMLIKHGQFEEGLEQLELALEILMKENLLKASSEYLKGVIYYQMGRGYLICKHDAKKALDLLRISRSILLKYSNPIRLTFIYDNMGRALSELGSEDELNKAQNYIEKAKRVREKCNHEIMVARIEMSLGNLYQKRSFNTKAADSFQNAQAIYDRLNRPGERGLAWFALGSLYIQLDRRSRAIEALELAKNLFQSIDMYDKVREAYLELHKLKMPKALADQSLNELLQWGKNEHFDFRLNEVNMLAVQKWIEATTSANSQSLPIALRDTSRSNDLVTVNLPSSNHSSLVLSIYTIPDVIPSSNNLEMYQCLVQHGVTQSLLRILAVGGTPSAVCLQVDLVKNVNLEYVADLIQTISDNLKVHNITSINIDIQEREEQLIRCIGIGTVENNEILQRNTAKEGQVVAITLTGIQNGSSSTNNDVRKLGMYWSEVLIQNQNLSVAHNLEDRSKKNWMQILNSLPSQSIKQAIKAGYGGATIDTVQGLLGSLQALSYSSGVGFVLYEELIESAIDLQAQELGINPTSLLLSNGYNSEIVLTVDDDKFDSLRQLFYAAGNDLVRLGKVEHRRSELKEGVLLMKKNEKKGIVIPYSADIQSNKLN
ncbi:MAG: hypothetical protein AAF702_42900 [Chloroflexota bacterium]